MVRTEALRESLRTREDKVTTPRYAVYCFVDGAPVCFGVHEMVGDMRTVAANGRKVKLASQHSTPINIPWLRSNSRVKEGWRKLPFDWRGGSTNASQLRASRTASAAIVPRAVQRVPTWNNFEHNYAVLPFCSKLMLHVSASPCFLCMSGDYFAGR